jgi:hypothetical protein
MRSICVLTIFLALSTTAFAQGARLADFPQFKTFRCDFTESEGRRTAAGVTTSANRETFSDLVVDDVDYSRNTARIIGNAGSDNVSVIDGRLLVTFIEVTLTGNVNILSIFKTTGSLISYRAVYSRHSALTTGDVTISQSYGSCRGLL